MLAIYGAGSVGLALGARLARAGEEVLFITRDADAARAIDQDSVRYEDPGSGEQFEVRATAVADVRAAAERIGPDPVLFCMRRPEAEAASSALAEHLPGALVASLQSDVDGDAVLARHFARVLSGVVRQTCTRREVNSVAALGKGRLVVGHYTGGLEGEARALALRLANAGYDVGVSERIAEDKWLKLCVNLMSAPNALIRRNDHATRAFVELKAGLLEEARAVLEAARITARSCDGRDRSLDAEIVFQREALARGTSARALPIYNQVWMSLERRSGSLEADRYHQRILDLAREHAIPAPLNARMLDALERAAREACGPESMTAAEILGA